MNQLPTIRPTIHTFDGHDSIRIQRGQLWSVKVSLPEALRLADQLVDLVEQHEKVNER